MYSNNVQDPDKAIRHLQSLAKSSEAQIVPNLLI